MQTVSINPRYMLDAPLSAALRKACLLDLQPNPDPSRIRPRATTNGRKSDSAFFTIRELAERWHSSRATVYNRLRGELVLDFARTGHKGKKLVPIETVRRIEQRRLRRLR